MLPRRELIRLLIFSTILISSGCMENQEANWEVEELDYVAPEDFETSIRGLPSDLGDQTQNISTYAHNEDSAYIAIKKQRTELNNSLKSNNTIEMLKEQASDSETFNQTVQTYNTSNQEWVQINQSHTSRVRDGETFNYSQKIHVTNRDETLYIFEYAQLESVDSNQENAPQPPEISYYSDFRESIEASNLH